MSRVAVFGGSFSPVHSGHIAVAQGVLTRGLADEVWMTPCRLNPLKDGSALLPDSTRIYLLEKAVDWVNSRLADSPVKICDVELGMPSPSYTADTLRLLALKYPEHNFRLLTGADSYLDFERWKDWEWIESNFSPVVYPRPGSKMERLRPSWTLLDNVEETDISSTVLREKLNAGEDVKEWMPWIESK